MNSGEGSACNRLERQVIGDERSELQPNRDSNHDRRERTFLQRAGDHERVGDSLVAKVMTDGVRVSWWVHPCFLSSPAPGTWNGTRAPGLVAETRSKALADTVRNNENGRRNPHENRQYDLGRFAMDTKPSFMLDIANLRSILNLIRKAGLIACHQESLLSRRR
jgi:hypothetical protein